MLSFLTGALRLEAGSLAMTPSDVTIETLRLRPPEDGKPWRDLFSWKETEP